MSIPCSMITITQRKESLATKLYRPTANCLEAEGLDAEWSQIAKWFKKGSKQYETACLRYKWHLAKCAVCREGLSG